MSGIWGNGGSNHLGGHNQHNLNARRAAARRADANRSAQGSKLTLAEVVKKLGKKK